MNDVIETLLLSGFLGKKTGRPRLLRWNNRVVFGDRLSPPNPVEEERDKKIIGKERDFLPMDERRKGEETGGE